jgi:hypothetical protein
MHHFAFAMLHTTIHNLCQQASTHTHTYVQAHSHMQRVDAQSGGMESV